MIIQMYFNTVETPGSFYLNKLSTTELKLISE